MEQGGVLLMPELQFFGQSVEVGNSRWGGTSRLINLYSQPIGNRRVLRTVIGSEDFSSPSGLFCRAMAEVSGRLYAVFGPTLYEIEHDGTATSKGTVSNDRDCCISGNNGEVTVTAGGNYYVLTGSSLESPDDGAFSAYGSVGFFNQYTILTEKDGRRVQWSQPADAKTLDGLDFASAEARDDNIIRGMAVTPEYWIFKEQSIERWGAGGAGGISVIPGAVIEKGLKSFRLVSAIPNGAVFVGTDDVVYLAGGGALQPISTAGVSYSLSNESPESVIYYEDEGQQLCAVTFSDRPAWVFSLATREWHERASGNGLKAWEARRAVAAYGSYFIGTDANGIKRLVRTNKDGSDVIVQHVGEQRPAVPGAPGCLERARRLGGPGY